MPSLHSPKGTRGGDGVTGGGLTGAGGTGAGGVTGAGGTTGGVTGAGGAAGGAGGLGLAGSGDSVLSVREEQPGSLRSTLPSLSSSLPLAHCAGAGALVGVGSGLGLISTVSGSLSAPPGREPRQRETGAEPAGWCRWPAGGVPHQVLRSPLSCSATNAAKGSTATAIRSPSLTKGGRSKVAKRSWIKRHRSRSMSRARFNGHPYACGRYEAQDSQRSRSLGSGGDLSDSQKRSGAQYTGGHPTSDSSVISGSGWLSLSAGQPGIWSNGGLQSMGAGAGPGGGGEGGAGAGSDGSGGGGAGMGTGTGGGCGGGGATVLRGVAASELSPAELHPESARSTRPSRSLSVPSAHCVADSAVGGIGTGKGRVDGGSGDSKLKGNARLMVAVPAVVVDVTGSTSSTSSPSRGSSSTKATKGIKATTRYKNFLVRDRGSRARTAGAACLSPDVVPEASLASQTSGASASGSTVSSGVSALGSTVSAGAPGSPASAEASIFVSDSATAGSATRSESGAVAVSS